MDETVGGTNETVARPGVATGATLRAAREAIGLSLADVAARTRVPLRHLEGIEAGSYDALPSPTYAVGFARSYARAVGADEVAVAAGVRAELARAGTRATAYEPYQIPDPARVPSRGLAIASAGAALAVLILAALWFATDLFRPGASSVTASLPASGPTAAAPTAAPTPAGGQVRLTATGEVWLRVYDADDKTLYLGVMKEGEHFDVPADARDPKVNVGRPDKLAVTLNGAAIPPLGTGDHAIKDVRIGAAALAGKTAGATPLADPTAAPTATPAPTATASASPRPASTATARPRPAKRRLTETQRANLQSAASPPAATGNSAP